MSHYLCSTGLVQRSKGKSFSGAVSYISGRSIKDYRSGEIRRNNREDVLSCRIYHPAETPERMLSLQGLSDAIEQAECRKNSQDARWFICALPNELPLKENQRIVDNFVNENFVNRGLIAVAAIHEGHNKDDPSRNNPHVHILVAMRTVGYDGFCRNKDREQNGKTALKRWRESLEREINRAYERNHIPERVSCKSYKVQGRDDIHPRMRLSRAAWERRRQNGDMIRVYRKHQQKRDLEKEKKLELLRPITRMR